MENPLTKENKFAELTAENILNFDISKLSYEDTVGFRQKLREIRKTEGLDFGYDFDVWPEHRLRMYLTTNEKNLDFEELIFQEKDDYVRYLTREKRFDEASDFQEKYWTEEVDDLEWLKRHGKAPGPVSNSPSEFNYADNVLNCGRRDCSEEYLFEKNPEDLKPKQKMFVDFIHGLGEDMVVLDLACGLGSAFTRMLVRIGALKKQNRINVDLDPRNIEKLNEDSESGVNFVSDASELPLPDENIDFIVFNMALADNYITTKNREAILAQVLRVLKPGGYITGSTGFTKKQMEQYFQKIDTGTGNIYQKK